MKHPAHSAAPPSPAAVSPAPCAAPARERWTVDGIEETPRGRLARLERPDGDTADISLAELPPGLQEGDLLEVELGQGRPKFTILHAETSHAQQQAQAKLEALNAAGQPDPDKEITL